MPKLGEILRGDQTRKLIDQQFTPGCIVLLCVTFPNGTTKEKFLVLVGSDAEDLHFVINSKPSKLIQRTSELAACQVTIDAATHTFLQYDSHINCTDVLRLPRARVLDELAASPGRVKGRASGAVVEQIVAAVKRAPTLSVQQQNLIVQALQGCTDEPE